VVLVVALSVGSSHRSASQTPAQRAAALDAQLKCPSCEDVSVAASSAASAVSIRQLVLTDIEAGQSNATIVAYLQSRYPGIELKPSASGLEGIVWFAPLVAFVAALFAVGALFWRRRSTMRTTALADEDRRLVADALGAAKSGARP
jgi:cytochrome c-type biogenesis protein CcmH